MTDTPTLRDLAAAAGYYRHLDLDRLLVDVRRHPGCDAVTGPTLANYMHGRTRTPRHVAEALAVILGVSLEVIVRGAK